MTLLTAADLLPELDLSILHPSTIERRKIKVELIAIDPNLMTGTLRDFLAKHENGALSIDDILDATIETDASEYYNTGIIFFREEPESDEAFAARIQQTYDQRKASLDRKVKDQQTKAKKKDNDRIVALTTKVLNNTATTEEREEVLSRLRNINDN